MNILSLFATLLLVSLNLSKINALEILPFPDETINIRTEVYVEDSLKKIDFDCKKFSIYDTPNSIKEIKHTIDENKSYVLAYKKDLKWVIEKDMIKGLSIINSSKSKKLLYCEDNIRISGISYPDVRYAVIIQ